MPPQRPPAGIPLEAWRQTARHSDIAETADEIARLVREHLPAAFLAVRRIDLDRRLLETVAAAACTASPPPSLRARTECSPEGLHELLAWCRQGATRRGVLRAGDALLDLAAPQGAAGGVIVGPLGEPDRPSGLLVALAGANGGFSRAHELLVASLLEPVAVALANDARLHELTRLREALEADKRALLSRLDRQDVSDAIVGAGTGLRTVLERVEQVARTDTPVLIVGETGTGKEVIARAIHSRSRRAAGPIVRVNCGAIPPGLVDSELFGHERGSFTGAVAARQGVFERADGGTLFLDEIGELPLEAQVRLLRVLQDGAFERVGGHRTLQVDVRMVAATHRDLQQMVAQRLFREDLWYRIGVFPIPLPPLRERVEDVPVLAAHFAWRAGNRLAGAPLVPTPQDAELLVAYHWPGNVRELAAVIERAAILGGGYRLDVAAALGGAAVSRDQHRTATPLAPATPLAASAPNPGVPVPLADAMARHIESALALTRGRIEGPRGAAAVLRINPHTLRARMRRLGVDWRRFRA
jgi:transcriptional regulator with GAF, ATPase, and Fis domain